MNILNLADYTILQMDEREREYRITAQVAQPPRYCPHCASINPAVHRFGRLQQLVMDLPMHGKRVGILIPRQRYRCRECGRTFLEPLPNVDENHNATTRLVDFVRRESLSRTFTSIADEIGIHERTVRRIFNEYLAELNERWEREVETPRWLGIDELTLTGGLRCILTNVEMATAVDLLEKRDAETVRKRLHQFKDKERVEVVVIDMWRPYRDAARSVFPQATIVIDKFHVERMATLGLDTIRKGLREQLTDRQRRQLKRDRFLLLSRPHRLNAQDELILETWTLNFPELKRAYDLKEQFYRVYEATTREEGAKRLDEWVEAIPDDLRPAFQPLLTALGNWRNEILAYFDHRTTNAYTEGLNGLAKMANRQGRGYSFDVIRAKLLHHIGARRGKRDGYDRQWSGPHAIGEERAAYGVPGQELLYGRLYGADMTLVGEPITIPLTAFIGGHEEPLSTRDEELGGGERGGTSTLRAE